jgi:hypothetical protein
MVAVGGVAVGGVAVGAPVVVEGDLFGADRLGDGLFDGDDAPDHPHALDRTTWVLIWTRSACRITSTVSSAGPAGEITCSLSGTGS